MIPYQSLCGRNALSISDYGLRRKEKVLKSNDFKTFLIRSAWMDKQIINDG